MDSYTQVTYYTITLDHDEPLPAKSLVGTFSSSENSDEGRPLFRRGFRSSDEDSDEEPWRRRMRYRSRRWMYNGEDDDEDGLTDLDDPSCEDSTDPSDRHCYCVPSLPR